MGTEVVDPTKNPMEAFQERVIEKIKADIGAMLPPEVLEGLAKKAVEEQFFKPRIRKNEYGRVESEKPSWFVEEVAKHAQPLIAEAVKSYVAANEETVKKAIQEFLAAQNMAAMMFVALRESTNADLFRFGEMIAQTMQRNR